MFYVGQKVVCVDDKPIQKSNRMDGLSARTIYTIRWSGIEHGEPSVRLMEIVRPVRLCLGDAVSDLPYLARRFRLLAERKTDISIFTRMLDDVKSRETV